MFSLRPQCAALLLFASSPVHANKPQPWVLRFDGIGPVRVGMTLPQVNSAMGKRFQIPSDPDEKDCFYINPTKHPGLAIMLLHQRVARVDVDGTDTPTSLGIRNGDSEKRTLTVYGSRMRVEPSFYDAPDGHYLTIFSPGKRVGIRFESYDGKIKRFYAGTREAIAFVEGCS